MTDNTPRPRAPCRAVSWWLTMEDLAWPTPALAEKVERRADTAAESGVTLLLIFGAHFRWDFMPLWPRLHDLIACIREHARERDIALFDHHSSTGTHRPRNADDVAAIHRRNRHHVPYFPSREEAAAWSFQGRSLNAWRMLDVATGDPLFLPQYTAEQFCMNNPDFRQAYLAYVRQLVRETGIDGLMSDDGMYYGGWKACGCRWCRERFEREYGHAIPPVADAGFWGNRGSPAFRDYLAMRYATCAEHLRTVREALPPEVSLLTCHSGSDVFNAWKTGGTCQDFVRHTDLVMLEMCGSTPGLDGTWGGRIGSQMLHLGIGRDHARPCIGLGYGFFPDTAFFVWALNKVLGSGTWFSTLKGRLGLPDADVAVLADDTALVAEPYRWERDHPHLFSGTSETDVAVLFSRATRDMYGEIHNDYTRDYQEACTMLMRDGIDFEVVTAVPRSGAWAVLVLSNAACMSREERERLTAFLEAGGIVIATAQLGTRDERGGETGTPWLAAYGIDVSVEEPPRSGGYPPFESAGPEVAQCSGARGGVAIARDAWVEIDAGRGRLLWSPGRLGEQRRAADIRGFVGQRGAAYRACAVIPPPGWYVRRFVDGGRLLFHGIPVQVKTEAHPTLRNRFLEEAIVERIAYPPSPAALVVRPRRAPASIAVHSPDLAAPRRVALEAAAGDAGGIPVSLDGIRRFFTVEIAFADGRDESDALTSR